LRTSIRQKLNVAKGRQSCTVFIKFLRQGQGEKSQSNVTGHTSAVLKGRFEYASARSAWHPCPIVSDQDLKNAPNFQLQTFSAEKSAASSGALTISLLGQGTVGTDTGVS